jgi:hypothetical protein
MKNKPFYLSDEHTRSFGGKLTEFESREEAIREKKHLKAYLAGKQYFNYGFESIPLSQALGLPIEVLGEQNAEEKTVRVPKRYEVKEIWTPKNN